MNASTPSMTELPANPELALVELQLGVAAAELRDLARCLRDRDRAQQFEPGVRPRTVAPAWVEQTRKSTSRKPAPTPSRTMRALRRRVAPVAACLVCAVAVGASALGAVPAAGPRPEATRADAQASASALHERATRDARASRIYTWSAVPGARRFEVQILRGGQSVFEATTRRLAVVLPEDLQMPAGRYTWLVTPIFESGSSSARPVVEATFLVAP